MKKKGIIIIAILAVVLIAMQIFVNVGNSSAKMTKKNLTVVKTPDQEEAMENDQFKVKEYKSPTIEGKNVALNAIASDNGYTDVYPASQAVDGRRESSSYWEGPSDKDESIITVNMKKAYNIHTIRIGLNPDPIWGPRTQTLSISVSEDGKKYTELVPSKDYEFDPNTGNEIVISDFKETKAQYVKVSITKNTGAKGGQIAELEVYSKDK